MRFSCQTKKILNGVILISNLCQTRTTKPILQGVKILVDQNEVQLLGTDLEVAVRYRISEPEIEEQGIVVIPAQKFLNMLREITDERVNFTVDQNVFLIQSQDAKFKLISDDPDEFPIIPDYDFKDAMEVNVSDFVKYTNKTLFSVAKDMSCYAYNGILIELYEDGIKFVATDGRRLAVAGNVDHDRDNMLSSSVVPVKGVIQIEKGFNEEDSTILLKLHKNQFIMKTNTTEIAARLIEGDFPNYRDVVLQEKNMVIKVQREIFHAILKKAAITAGTEVRSVLFTFKPGLLHVFSQQEGIGEAESEIPVEYDGEKFEVTFNPDFIMDYLRVMNNENVQLNFKDEQSACMIEDSDREFYIVMPITA